MNKQKLLILLVLVLVPFIGRASIVINEIAWMGTDNSANDEWIELYNNGNEDVSLDDWNLEAEDGSPIINLSGNIFAGDFFLLERTDDTSVPDVLADLIYTGALENGGEVLILKDSNGAEVQRIDATDGWPAGDNSTKQTMQRDGSSWITADPTPKAQNAGLEAQPPSEEPELSEPSESTSGIGSSWPVEPQIFANAGEDRVAVVGADAKFSGQALGLKKEPLENARYLWSFGDGSIREGQNVLHLYQYPGEYIVVLNVSSGKYSASDRILVKVIPNQLKISEANDEFIKLHNESGVTLDISNWFLKLRSKTFKFPETTLIKAGAKLPIPSSISGIEVIDVNREVLLLYPNGAIAYSYFGYAIAEVKVPKTIEPTPGVGSIVKVKPLQNPQETESQEKHLATSTNSQQAASIITITQNDSWGTKEWFLLVLGFGVVAGIGVIFLRRQLIK